MKTYCAILPGGKVSVFQADTVFSLDDCAIAMHETAFTEATRHHRPLSLRVPWGWITRNEGRLPVHIAGRSYIIVATLCQA